MSEHGSWANKIIHCDKCAEAFRAHMEEAGRVVCVTWNRYAGEVKGLYDGEEADTIATHLSDLTGLCEGHEVIVAVLCDGPVVLLRVSNRKGVTFVERCRPVTVWEQEYPHIPTQKELEREAYTAKMHKRLAERAANPLPQIDAPALIDRLFKTSD